jgi:GTP pyrophosphokinase
MIQWFKKERYEENVERGKEIITRELKRLRLTQSDLFKSEWVEPLLKQYTFAKLDDCYAAIGYGAVQAGKIIGKLKEEYDKVKKAEEADDALKNTLASSNKSSKRAPVSGVIVKGLDNCLVRLSKCCNPLPGDEIVGYITRGRGVSVHRSDCPNINEFVDNTNRLIEVEWYKAANTDYIANIQVIANDRKNLLADISTAVTDVKGKINAVMARVSNEKIVVVQLEVQLQNIEHLTKTIKALKKVDSVFEVRRRKN